ncbi:MAG: hypothetical protein IKH75_14195 [Ruminococcus sp.]|nr:hypothetical protein [Ruminococcus sp.]
MDDLISRQAAINAPVRMVSEGIEWIPVYHVENLPSAQPERMKGNWVRKESDLSWWYECSECGESPLFDPYEHEVRSQFCPWCGARMEEEEDETD